MEPSAVDRHRQHREALAEQHVQPDRRLAFARRGRSTWTLAGAVIMAHAFKNLLITCGAIWLSYWVLVPLAFGLGLFTGIVYKGNYSGTVVMRLVENLPLALVAAFAGAAIVSQVESARPIWWVILAATLYVSSGFFIEYHWVHPPGLLDRVTQIMGAAFPATACILGGLISIRRAAAGNKSSAV